MKLDDKNMSAAILVLNGLTDEQHDALALILSPACCHITGMHNPTHWENNPVALCEAQKAKAWDRAVALLDIEMGPATSDPTCGWCKRRRERARQFANVDGLDTATHLLPILLRRSTQPGSSHHGEAAPFKCENEVWTLTARLEGSIYQFPNASFVRVEWPDVVPDKNPDPELPPPPYKADPAKAIALVKHAIASESMDEYDLVVHHWWFASNGISFACISREDKRNTSLSRAKYQEHQLPSEKS